MTREEFIAEEIESIECTCALCKAEAVHRLGRLWDVATAAERERCAQIAGSAWKSCDPSSGPCPGIAVCDWIEERIRSGE